MKFIMYLLFLSVVILFSGCAVSEGSVTIGKYEKEYIGNEINPFLYKVEKESVCIENYSKHFERMPGERTWGYTLDIDAGEIASNITKDFFSQYFKDVYFSNNCMNTNAFLKVKFDINDFRYVQTNFNGGGEVTSDIKYSIAIGREGKLFEKQLYLHQNNEIVFRIYHTAKRGIVELYHKTLLDELERQLKPDLIKFL